MAIPAQARFLIAEDDAPTRERLLSHLKSLGFKGEILEAENGADAYTLFIDEMTTGKKIDFVISDMIMPVSSGYEFLVSMRKDPSFQDVPFLMLTSKSDRDIIFKCVKAKVSNYLIKPWNLQVLGEKIHSCWNKHYPE